MPNDGCGKNSVTEGSTKIVTIAVGGCCSTSGSHMTVSTAPCVAASQGIELPCYASVWHASLSKISEKLNNTKKKLKSPSPEEV